jgi:PPOX class probable F420-dependent enzyme
VSLGGLSPEETAFVGGARVGRLATVDAAGRPHVVPVCFAVREGRAYIALDEKRKRVPAERLRRVRNILGNPVVQLLVDEYSDDWSRLRFVQLRGRARLVASAEERAAALSALRAKYSQYGSMRLEEHPLIAIEVDGAVAWAAGPPADPSLRQPLPPFPPARSRTEGEGPAEGGPLEDWVSGVS